MGEDIVNSVFGIENGASSPYSPRNAAAREACAIVPG